MPLELEEPPSEILASIQLSYTNLVTPDYAENV